MELASNRYIVLFATIAYLILSIYFLAGYLQPGLTLYIGLAILPFVFQVNTTVYSNRHLIPALLFATLALFIPAKSTVYFSLVFISLLLFESFKGKINSSILFILIIISPLFKFFSDTLGFPLRLWLSDVVTKTIAFAGMHARSAGNIIYIDHYEFYIDQACAGLNMLNVSLLLGIFILGVHQKKEGRSLNIFQSGVFLALIFLLNIFSNFSRILLIVIFKIMPETLMHDLIGMISMISYVILPLIGFMRPIIKHYGKLQATERTKIKKQSSATSIRDLSLIIALLLLVGLSILVPKNPNMNYHNNSAINLPGYEKTWLDNSVLKFENNTAIIYMKPTPFYAPEHNPMICWTGSGYEFKFIRKQIIKGTELYTGVLEKGKDKLYAAWWFDNGKIKTISQLHWRWNAAKGNGNFHLVNVNTAKQSDLWKITGSML